MTAIYNGYKTTMAAGCSSCGKGRQTQKGVRNPFPVLFPNGSRKNFSLGETQPITEAERTYLEETNKALRQNVFDFR